MVVVEQDREPGTDRRPEGSPRKRPGRGAGIARVVGVIAIVVGAVLVGASLLFPQATEKATGDVKVTTQKIVSDVSSAVQEQVTGEKTYPQVTLGVQGGKEQLDYCDGTFTQMLSYEREGVPPVWAAHNNCGGDVLLPWEVGTQIQIAGDDTVYEIVDIRYTSKIWSSTSDLVGLHGDLALQSCFYGEDRMKFIGLSPVG